MTNLEVLLKCQEVIAEKKIITKSIKKKLEDLGFKEVVIGSKNYHEINSKEIRVNFYGYDIAIGIASHAISYGDGRQYRAMAIKL